MNGVGDFEPPRGLTHTDVLFQAHHLRIERNDHAIESEHVADAIEILCEKSTSTLSN